jgi:hypothetical protein
MSNSKVDLTCDEHMLHHHASAIKKHLEVSHAEMKQFGSVNSESSWYHFIL